MYLRFRRFLGRDEDGFSSCLACPCRRAVSTTPPERRVSSVSLRRIVRPSPSRYGLGLRNLSSDEATSEFTHVTARGLAHHPEDGFVSPLHPFRFLHEWDSGYGALTSTSVGLSPTEQASLSWTHIVTKTSSRNHGSPNRPCRRFSVVRQSTSSMMYSVTFKAATPLRWCAVSIRFKS